MADDLGAGSGVNVIMKGAEPFLGWIGQDFSGQSKNNLTICRFCEGFH